VATNKKRVLVTHVLGAAGWDLLRSREDIEAIAFENTVAPGDFLALLSGSEVNAVILGLTSFGEAECAASRGLEVLARIGVGYDSVDVPALTRHQVPLMVVGTANSPTVAEHALYLMMALAKRGAELAAIVRSGQWVERFTVVPVDLIDKTVLVVGFGRIGSRIAKRCLAMDMRVLVYDPYIPAESVQAAGCEPVAELDAALPRADFVTIHCPKTPETIGMFGKARLERLKPTAYLVNTARGGIIDEAALYVALDNALLAGAGLDVFDQEPADRDNPLLRLPTVVTSPHMAGVSRESIDRMAAQAALNVLSVFDGRPIRDNVVNPEVLAGSSAWAAI
jgi:D-3-phosphoglycerate dehydrogenase / 2-oxoglutarate reductase